MASLNKRHLAAVTDGSRVSCGRAGSRPSPTELLPRTLDRLVELDKGSEAVPRRRHSSVAAAA